jgi:hypothetical protein
LHDEAKQIVSGYHPITPCPPQPQPPKNIRAKATERRAVEASRLAFTASKESKADTTQKKKRREVRFEHITKQATDT